VASATRALGLLAADYAMQLAVVTPSLLRGEGRDVVLLLMYNPHGVFIALEDAGYVLVALALGAVALVGRRAWPAPRTGSRGACGGGRTVARGTSPDAPPDLAPARARLGLLVFRGLLLDLVGTDDRAGVDAASR
jgi:hypothetical protein